MKLFWSLLALLIAAGAWILLAPEALLLGRVCEVHDPDGVLRGHGSDKRSCLHVRGSVGELRRSTVF